MPKLYLGEALALVGKTLPFVWVRLGSYALLGVGLLAYFAVLGGIALLLGRLWAPLGVILFLATAGGAFAVVSWASRYYFHLLRAAHTAVMTEYIVFGSVPADQLAHGRRAVTERFGGTSALFAVDVLVAGAVKAFVRSFVRIASIVPVPGLRGIGNLLERVALMSTTYVDEAILSRAYREREQNIWQVAQDGVILYAQAWQPILTNAVVLVLIGYVEFVVLLVVLGLPAVALSALVPALSLPLGIAVVVGAWMVKLAVSDAFSLAATLIAYHRGTEGMLPNPQWKAQLESVSDRFKQLGRKAAEGAAERRVEPAALWDEREEPEVPMPDERPAPGWPPAPDGPGAPDAPRTPDAPESPPSPEPPPPPGTPPRPGTPEPPSEPPMPDVPEGPGSPRPGEPKETGEPSKRREPV